MVGLFEFPADISYARFYRGKQVLRVARVSNGLCMALCPTKDKNAFAAEAFREADEESRKVIVPRQQVKDKVWLRLLDGETIEQIVADYESCAGYHVHRSVRSQYDPIKTLELPTFRIAEDSQDAGDGTPIAKSQSVA